VEKIDPPQDGFARANNGYEIIGVAAASTIATSHVARDAGAQVVVSILGRP
jgi:hypothetical protein